MANLYFVNYCSRKLRAKYRRTVINSSSEIINPSFCIALSVSAQSSGVAKCCLTRFRSWHTGTFIKNDLLTITFRQGAEIIFEITDEHRDVVFLDLGPFFNHGINNLGPAFGI